MSAREHLGELIAAAERDLISQTGNEAACVLHRDGRVIGGMKCHEGRLVALTRARRMLDAAAPVPALETAAAE